MDNDELNEKLAPFFSVHEVRPCNFKPHPYTITPDHLTRNDSMYLGTEQILAMEKRHGAMCGHKERGKERCRLLYSQHTADKVMLLNLLSNVPESAARETLKKIVPEMEAEGIDGFAFMESEFKIVADGG